MNYWVIISITFLSLVLLPTAMLMLMWAYYCIILKDSPELLYLLQTSLITWTKHCSGDSNLSFILTCRSPLLEPSYGRFVQHHIAIWKNCSACIIIITRRFFSLQLLIPSETPLGDKVDFDRLSQHEMSGGNIKNCVFRAAARAAIRYCQCLPSFIIMTSVLISPCELIIGHLLTVLSKWMT